MNSERIIRGCWQLSAGHNLQDVNAERSPIYDAIDCGFSTFDAADIYTGVEAKLGDAIRYAQTQGKKIRVHTKFVPDRDKLESIDRAYVESIIDRTRQRLNVECVDLVQFHWWDFRVHKFKETLGILSQLKAEGKIGGLGLTNVNTAMLSDLSKDFDIESVQSQVSLIDRRILGGMLELCQSRSIRIFAYGSLLGGFFHETWLNTDQPTLVHLENRSLVKYKLIIEDAWGWELFQKRLGFLKELADKYETRIANVCLAVLFQKKWASHVIVGLSPIRFYEQNRGLLKPCILDDEDLHEISSWECALEGDVYDLERDLENKHAKIMKYNLNREF